MPGINALGVHLLNRSVFAVPDLAPAEIFYRAFGLDVRREGNRLDLYTHGHPHCWTSPRERPAEAPPVRRRAERRGKSTLINALRPGDVQPGLEADRPETVRRFTGEVARVAAVLFVSPEHNRSLPAVLKNAIDWGSKPTDKQVWRGRVAAIAGTSFGAFGTAVGQQYLRQILGILGMTVMGGEAYISFKPDPVDHDGNFIDDSKRAFCQAYMDQFVALVARFADLSLP